MSGIPVVVHPQAILQIADHVSRSAFFDPPRDYLCGFILGTSDGPRIEIHSTLEVNLLKRSSRLAIDRQTFNTMLRQHNAIYPSEVPIGWYTGGEYSPEQLRELREVFEAIDHPEEYIRGEFIADREQPLCLYANDRDSWTRIEYSYESELAERIAMIQLQAEGSAESQVQFTADAYRSLDQHLAAMEEYLIGVAEGNVEFDPVAVRKCADVCQWWTHKREEADEEMVMEQEKLALLIGMVAENATKFMASLPAPDEVEQTDPVPVNEN